MKFRNAARLLACLSCVTAASATIVGSYNIRYDNPGDEKAGNGWKQRAPVIASLIRFHDFDVLGTQEGFHHQMEDLCREMPEYGCSMHGRDDGKEKGEHIGIFFKRDKYELQEDGFFWLSEHPDQAGPGWDASLPRICGWAKLLRKADQKTFYVFSLHLDHRGPISRKEGIALVLRKIDEMAKDAPVYLMGDFNTDQNSESYKEIEDSPHFADTYNTATVRFALNGTPNKFDPDAKTENRIDHIFVREGVPVRRYGVLTDSYRIPKNPAPEESKSGNFPKEVTFQDFESRLPSDHFPVLAEVMD
ncbi:endonuclease/exonuclease/phosphatase family protein [Luteolibacter luteus]|uniref:Endonuclease/exonuclease/phosphatase family protein n=1 Tax=Luteolibacter luteus TaxID=2728835 RepID=A0A858RHD0_9BACT|nr:endonuclease/exonuclease/phosphatase family protein [Luteolibacter luteus]QJE96115.1 endonuclease/exonuclease/phosphatase family protein [Luteolibacter luteus]